MPRRLPPLNQAQRAYLHAFDRLLAAENGREALAARIAMSARPFDRLLAAENGREALAARIAMSARLKVALADANVPERSSSRQVAKHRMVA